MYATNLIPHFRSIYQSANKIGAQIKVDFSSLHLEINRDGKYFELAPTFASPRSDQPWFDHSATMSAVADSFVGWGLDRFCSSPIGDNKIAFKKFCDDNELRTPALFVRSANSKTSVLIKEIAAIQRGAIRGPMPVADAFANGVKSLEGFYVEEFVEGDSFQAWYFAGQLACVERRKKPTIIGDGKSSVRELIAHVSASYATFYDTVVKFLLQAQGLSMDTILQNEQVAVVDLRFHSVLQPVDWFNENIINELAETQILDQLKHAGAAIFDQIPIDSKDRAIFSVHGVIDNGGKVWFTSMGAKQYIHPDVYSRMIPAMFEI